MKDSKCESDLRYATNVIRICIMSCLFSVCLDVCRKQGDAKLIVKEVQGKLKTEVRLVKYRVSYACIYCTKGWQTVLQVKRLTHELSYN